jgi:hypothetical protein
MRNQVRDTTTVSVFGTTLTPATVCEAPADQSCREYRIPASETARYNGFVEIMFSQRGLTQWPLQQTTDRPAEELLQVTGFRFEAK